MQHTRDTEDHPYGHDSFAGFYPDHQVSHGLEPQQLFNALRHLSACPERRRKGGRYKYLLPPELAALPDLIQMLDHNAWLDVGEIGLAEGGGYPEWSRENVEWLAEELRHAQPVLDGVLIFAELEERKHRGCCRETVGCP